MLLHALTIFAGAFLLFLVQPLIAKQILPWFGGSAAVWTTCLAFFQVMLLLGYAYAHGLTQWLKPRAQALVHTGLLLVSAVCLPITVSRAWQPEGGEDPGTRILWVLLVTIGLPYFLLSANGPLLQAWTTRAVAAAKVYRLFALSNLASLLALLCYPFAIEPWVTTHAQAVAWSVGYGAFAVLCATAALTGWQRPTAVPVPPVAPEATLPARPASACLQALAMAAMWLLLALTSTGSFHWLAERVGLDAKWLELFSARPWLQATTEAWEKSPWHGSEWLPVGDDVDWLWFFGQAACALLCTVAAGYAWWRGRAAARATPPEAVPAAAAAGTVSGDWQSWVALPLLSTWLLGAITNHLQQNVAAVPFLWLLPLSLYLLSFILCFDRAGWYRRWLFLPLLTLLLARGAFALQSQNLTLNINVAVPLYLALLFTACMYCHGELAARKPPARQLTTYYLSISAGGAIGGLLVGLLAPLMLDFEYELGAGFVLTALVSALLLLRGAGRGRWLLAVPVVLVAGLCGWWLRAQVVEHREEAVEQARSFYGTLCVKDDVERGTRRLIHGVILHGEEFLDPEMRDRVTTYYGEKSGVGMALQRAGVGKRVGVIGLGTGSIAAWGEVGDVFRFYDINPQVVDIARRRFTFLGDSRATIEVALGDARLSLQREEPQQFDVLVVDAFSSDAIPVHLITTEAVAIYLRHLKPEGVIAFHVTNRYLKLAPVVEQLAKEHGLHSVLIDDPATDSSFRYASDWVLVSRSDALANDEHLKAAAEEIEQLPGLRLWTDDYNNLLGILK